ncbi:MAG: HAMP domain-containing histidine kinase [Nannocystaceae bacterium]|nr:HAMP domain-containing histidine kinase [Nannocystaceae bacterium]
MSAPKPSLAPAALTLRGLVTARWVTVALMAAAASLMVFAPQLVAPVLSWLPTSGTIAGFVAILIALAMFNVYVARVVLPSGRATVTFAGLQLLADSAALTLMLGLTGGATNPFTTLYFVPITLATQVSPRWTWAVAGASLAGFGLLYLLGPLPQGPPGHEHHFAGHLQGMWFSFGVTGALITYFVHSIAMSVARQRAELTRLRDQALEDRHLASLGSLAAGAAHELGTPLGTIAVLASELPHMDTTERTDAVGSIRHEVSRCKKIVQRMSTPDARVHTLGADTEPWALVELGDEQHATGEIPVEVSFEGHSKDAACDLPRDAIGQILRELLANAAQACRRRKGQRAIRIRISASDAVGQVRVEDDGEGMDTALAGAAFDPFFSTKPEGSGMGLGLYLTRAQLRQLGGSISVESKPGHGTTVTINFPLAST